MVQFVIYTSPSNMEKCLAPARTMAYFGAPSSLKHDVWQSKNC